MTPSPPWIDRLRGRFVVFDGPDGSGKSTQFHRFAHFAAEHGLTVCEVREPGGTPIGEQVRNILLNPNNEICLSAEMLLYMASRAQLVTQRIRPALKRGELVLADRFISSTLAYQGTAGGLPTRDILDAARIAVGSTLPDLVVIFDVDEQVAAKRLVGGGKHQRYLQVTEPSLFSDRIELKGASYQRRVRQGYLEQAKADPDRYIVIDGSPDAQSVFDSLLTAMEDHKPVLSESASEGPDQTR